MNMSEFNWELLYDSKFLGELNERDRELFEEVGPEYVAELMRSLTEYDKREEVFRLSADKLNADQVSAFSEMLDVMPGAYAVGFTAYRDKDELELVQAGIQQERRNRFTAKWNDPKAESSQE